MLPRMQEDGKMDGWGGGRPQRRFLPESRRRTKTLKWEVSVHTGEDGGGTST